MAPDQDLQLSSYDYDLPKELIAQEPIEPRDSARLLVLDRASDSLSHPHVSDLPSLLAPRDLIVANHSRVLRSRLLGKKADTGGRVELTLIRPAGDHTWEALLRGHRLYAGQRIELAPEVSVAVGELTAAGRLVQFLGEEEVPAILDRLGQVPLPPYVREYHHRPERYQTVYGDVVGSAAAPTAGLHFTARLMDELRRAGVHWASLVLHIGVDTFRPVGHEDVRQHPIHTEWAEVTPEVVEAVRHARAGGGRVVAVGTSSVRALEFAARSGELAPYRGPVDLYILPGHRFQVVDALVTNFHMPRTTVLLLVAAFAGRERILDAYQEAIRQRYRFLSFGDAMLIL